MAAVLRFGDRGVPRSLRGLQAVTLPTAPADAADVIDGITADVGRVVVLGSTADLATVLTRLLRTERLDVEVAHVRRWWHARRAISAAAQRVPLIRDETGQVLAGAALWLPPDGSQAIQGEAIVDDTVLFDGEFAGVRVQPTLAMPGLRAAPLGPRLLPARWVSGRAAQLGTTGARVVRDGVPAPREVRRSTFYRHTQGWLRV
ncbi:MAG TPA: peptidase M50 [Mycobacterium sp.]|nr:peptidase M50 [Mycobacterium sp.]